MNHPYRMSVAPHLPDDDADVRRAAARFAAQRRRAMLLGFGVLAVPLLAALRFLYWWFVDPPCGFACM